MLDKVREIIQRDLHIDGASITRETRLKEDLNIDSLDAAQLIFAIEEELNIELPDDVIANAKTIGEIMDALN